jgi:GT2 family glycosyltransferase
VRASIIIPTFDRLAALRRVVAALRSQIGDMAEIVVVDDGSRDGTWAWLKGESAHGLRPIRQANSGPARARNRGVEEARAELIVFLGDDTVPQPGWLEAHLEAHRVCGAVCPLAVIGYTCFPPGQDSPFRRYINEYGAQFGYLLIDRAEDVPFNFFYTSNVSLPRSVFLEHGGFREDFPAAAWEDIEFAYRAAMGGLRLLYQPRARTVHEHCVHPGTFGRRQRTSGRSAAIFARLHPELEDFLGFGRLRGTQSGGALRCLLGFLVRCGEKLPGGVPPGIYQRFLDLCYLEGLAAGLQGQSRR